jgi:hypothetical protein
MSFRSDSSMPDRIDEAPDPNRGGWGLHYRCLQCRWTGCGGAGAFDHHRIAHHRIALTVSGDRVWFFCCPEEAVCAACGTGPRECPDCDKALCDCARDEHACPESRCGGCGERPTASGCRCDDDHEREAAHARGNDFADTNGRDWT